MMITDPKIENRSEQPYVGVRTQIAVGEFGNGIIPQLHGEARHTKTGRKDIVKRHRATSESE